MMVRRVMPRRGRHEIWAARHAPPPSAEVMSRSEQQGMLLYLSAELASKTLQAAMLLLLMIMTMREGLAAVASP